MKYDPYSCISRGGFLVDFDTQKRKKYDEDVIDKIRTLVLDGKSTRKIAKEVGLPHSSTYNIIKREGMIGYKNQSKPSLMYLDRSECKYQHDITDSDFDYIRSKHKDFTVNRDGKIYVHYSYFDKYKYGKEGYKNNYKNFNRKEDENRKNN